MSTRREAIASQLKAVAVNQASAIVGLTLIAAAAFTLALIAWSRTVLEFAVGVTAGSILLFFTGTCLYSIALKLTPKAVGDAD